MAAHSNLAWEIPWTEEPGGLQFMAVTKSQSGLSDFHSSMLLSPGYGWPEARSEDSSALSLKPEQDYLFNLPNIRPLLLEGIHSVQFSCLGMSSSLQPQ